VPPSPGIRVVRSSIHGYGIFATVDFREGDTLMQIDGIVGPAEPQFDDRYSVWLDGDVFMHITDQTRWLNHCCDPNVWIDGGLERGGWANLVALRDIRAGEELTSDYAYDLEYAEPCHCGSPSCSGWIVDEEARPQLLAAHG